MPAPPAVRGWCTAARRRGAVGSRGTVVADAVVDHPVAARREGAALRPGDVVADRAADLVQPPAAVAVQPGHGLQQPMGVRVPRLREQVVAPGPLDHLAGVEDVDRVAEPGHHPEVVGDHHQRRAGLVDQVLEQGEDLRLDGHVQRRRRLVGDQQARLAGQRDGDQRPLPHAAGELVRELLEPPRRVRDADRVEQSPGLPQRRLPGPCPGGVPAPRPPARRAGSPGSARTAGPGRSCRCPGRAGPAAPAGAA